MRSALACAALSLLLGCTSPTSVNQGASSEDIENMKRMAGDWVYDIPPGPGTRAEHRSLRFQNGRLEVYLVSDADRFGASWVILKGDTKYEGYLILRGRRLVGNYGATKVKDGFVSEDLNKFTVIFQMPTQDGPIPQSYRRRD